MADYDYYAQGALDIARPAKEVLVDRFNAINGTQLNPDHFTLSPVQEVSGQPYNATLWLMPVASSQWANGYQIFYNRLTLASLLAQPAEVRTNGGMNLYQLLTAINAAYGVYLTEADVSDEVVVYTVPTDNTSLGSVQLRSRATSVFFKGNITIPLNNTVSHGISTFNEEILHFAALRNVGGQDKVVAIDEFGNAAANYNYMSNVTLSNSRIDQMWKRTNGTLLVLGAFTYVKDAVTYNRKVVQLDRLGAVATASSGNLFGVDYAGLKYIPDFANDRVYALDKNGAIGGNAHGIHVYDDQGAYLNSFVSTLPHKAVALAPYQDKLYVVTQNQDAVPMLHRLLLTGVPDSTFTSIPVPFTSGRTGVDIGRVAALHAGSLGVVAALYADTITAEAVKWPEYSRAQRAAGISAPVYHVGHDGVPNANVSHANKLVTSARTGVGRADAKVAITDNAVLYSASLVNPSSGVNGDGIGAIQLDGFLPAACTQATSEQYPAFVDIVSMAPFTRGDIVVAANVQVQDTMGVQSAAGIYLFTFDGYFATQEVVLPNQRILACVSHLFT